ncbi:hypothetical protein Poly51_40240 [Rubripirellula tenax]|uniref:SPW repeat protein n=1 Tax=Rubripirellula tenax TaxID=2528015 RepID=A0A5C6ETR7_9BACT|nr:hypothetical protein [Rubripirellula tenax]TWU50731.1 hypothetical protein Poly51_40240 [Rubripirellula tenax]
MPDDPESLHSTNASRENLQLILFFVIVVLLLGACIAAPLLVAAWVHPAAGVLAAILAMIAWAYLGPPPMPGVLNGIVALTGLAVIFGVLVVCLIKTVSLWLA